MNNYELNLDSDYIEIATVALIREYLARKGFRQSLDQFDEENPRNEKTLNSRSKLVDYLGAQKLQEKNKSIKTPFKTILELLISYHSASFKNINNTTANNNNSSESEIMNFISSNNNKLLPSGSTKKKIENKYDLQIDDTNEGEAYDGNEKRIESKELELEKFKYNFTKSVNKKLTNGKKSEEDTKSQLVTNTNNDNNNNTINSSLEDRARELKEKNDLVKNNLINELNLNEESSKKTETVKRTFQLTTNRATNSSSISTPINNNNESKDYTIKAIDFETAKSLRMLIFGNLNQTFSDDWKNQSFNFSDIAKLKFGIVQKKGGPCGVLACVQAYLLKDLIFSSDEYKEPNTIFNVNKRDRTRSLAKGLANLVWKCSEKTNEAIVAIPTQKAHFAPVNKYKADGLTETLNLIHLNSYSSLENYMLKNINLFELDGTRGCVLLLYSAILSRTVQQIISDMDVAENKLMGMHGYCTQEMVNLLIHGRAVSNVFNDSIFLDQLELRGPNKRNDIGFLSLFEHYKSCEVGSYYKTPKYPIWVVCSESHFSVIFSIRKDIMSDWKAETCFDLYYYDGLAKQDEQIKLTLSTAKKHEGNEDPFFKIFNKSKKIDKDKELIPPLELVLKTKWQEASVDWNSTDPLL